MKNRVAVFFVVALVSFPLVFGCGTFSAKADEVVDVGNKLCPVGGGPVDGLHFVEHEGNRYGLCCAGCGKMFKQDPEKYIAKMYEQEPELLIDNDEGG